MPPTRPSSRDAALVELQRLHTAILASRARRGVGPTGGPRGSERAGDDASPETLAAQALTRRLHADAAGTAIESPVDEPRSRRLWWLAVAAAVVVAGVWAVTTRSPRPEVVTEAAPPPPEPAVEPAAPPPGSAPAANPPDAAPTPAIQVTLATIRPVWLRVTVDGARALEREVPAGETLSFAGDRAVVVRCGDAGAVQATLNGSDRGALGLRGWPLTVALTPAGIEPLTPTRPEP